MSALTRRPPTWGLVQHRSRFFGSSRGGGCLLEQGPDALLIGRSQSHRSQGFGECAAPSGVEGAPAVVGDSCWLRCKPQQHVRRLCPISEPCRYHHRWRCALMVVLIVCVCVSKSTSFGFRSFSVPRCERHGVSSEDHHQARRIVETRRSTDIGCRLCQATGRVGRQLGEQGRQGGRGREHCRAGSARHSSKADARQGDEGALHRDSNRGTAATAGPSATPHRAPAAARVSSDDGAGELMRAARGAIGLPSSTRAAAPPPGCLAELYHPRGRSPPTCRSPRQQKSPEQGRGETHSCRIRYTIDDPLWDADRVLRAFGPGPDGVADHPTSTVFRTRLYLQRVVHLVDSNIHPKFQVFFNESKGVFGVRPKRQGSRQDGPRPPQGPPPQVKAPPQPALLRASLVQAPQAPLRFWSGAAPKGGPRRQVAPPLFSVLRPERSDETIRPSAAPVGVQPRQMAMFFRSPADIMDAHPTRVAAPMLLLSDADGPI